MAQLLYTIDEYVANVRKKTTIWMVFNTVYNDVHAFKKEPSESDDCRSSYLNKEYTDQEAREEFLAFMQTHFPDIELVKVFDLVSVGYIEYPYLGSIAIDTDEGSEVYKALSEKYDDPETGDPLSNRSVLWQMSYEDGCAFYKERKEFIDAELGEGD